MSHDVEDRVDPTIVADSHFIKKTNYIVCFKTLILNINYDFSSKITANFLFLKLKSNDGTGGVSRFKREGVHLNLSLKILCLREENQNIFRVRRI